ncbi:MAG TPA: glutamate formimidoyltransferase [Myxococcota bacterium]|nr:glutamate formimidoyltransferase [Myxococcota bacterium]
MKLVECVPNFSVGRNRAVIDSIANAISSVEGATLLDVDPGADTNRTVMTLIGEPEPVALAAFQGIRRAAELIDMRLHSGTHARLGACDVCPFVPVRGVSMDECVALARGLGEWVAAELGVPVYLYEEAASRPARRNLAEVRRGEYESIPDRLGDPAWKPDFGSLENCEGSGATIIGAREFLVACNFNLNTRDRRIAHDIALDIREAGRARRDANGKILRYKSGRARRKPGKLEHVKAVGWSMPEFGCTQVSVNLTNYRKTPLAELHAEICRQAEKRGVRCTGSEIVGLVPQDCLLEAGRFFLRRAGKGAGVPRQELVRLAVQSLGLSELYPFEPQKKILEYRIPDPRPLVGSSLRDFADELSSDSPAPGGGSVAALCGALAASLACMVGQLTVGKKGYQKVSEEMKRLGERAQELKDDLLTAIDDDTAAFNQVMEALRLPRQTSEQKKNRAAAIQAATRQACEVPLRVMRTLVEVTNLAAAAATKGNKSSLSDAGVAGLCARAATEGAYYNVVINLAGIKEKDYASKQGREANRLLQQAIKTTDRISSHVRKSL